MGRKRNFDVDEVLDVAVRLFWERGYDGTSTGQICDVLGIFKPSLYRAFHSKEELFERVLDRYDQQYLQFVCDALKAPTAFEVSRRLFHGLIDVMTQPNLPRGALDINAAITGTSQHEALRQRLIARRSNYEEALTDRFSRAKRDGCLPEESRPHALAAFVLSMCEGIALQARAGASPTTLRDIADVALQAVPRSVACTA